MANMKLKCTRSKVVQINLFLKNSPTSSADALDSVDFPLETRMKKKLHFNSSKAWLPIDPEHPLHFYTRVTFHNGGPHERSC